MDHLFGAFMSRRFSGNLGSNSGRYRQNSSCDNIPDQVCVSKKRMLKRAASFCGRNLLSSAESSASNSELINIVDAQLMQIKEKLAAFREQDTQFRERMDLLSNSVSELSSSRSSISSFTPSDCSNLGSLDEAQRELPEEENSLEKQTVAFFKGSRDRFNYMRRATSDPSSLYSHIELPEEETMETERPHSTCSTNQAVNVYPQYNNPDEISTLF